MMNIKLLKAAVACMAFSLSGLSNAGLIDFNSMSDGLYSGNSDFTVTSYGGSESDSSITPLIRQWGGISFLCNSTDTNDRACTQYPTEDIIDFDFNRGIDYLTLSMFWAGNSGFASVSSYDINGVLLQSFGYSDGFTATYSFDSTADIYSIRTDSGRYANFGENYNWWYGINSIDYVASTSVSTSNFTSVPEPSTLAIFALGIICLTSRKSKKE